MVLNIEDIENFYRFSNVNNNILFLMTLTDSINYLMTAIESGHVPK